MHMASNYLRSLLLTAFLCFLAPMMLLGSAIALFLLLSSIPGLGRFGQASFEMIRAFLAAFGTGNVWEGLVVIGCACALVGSLFDTYTFYHHYRFRKL